MTRPRLSYRNNHRRREQQDRERRTYTPIKEDPKSPMTIGMIFRIAFMIITAGIFSGK